LAVNASDDNGARILQRGAHELSEQVLILYNQDTLAG
jgi:hypothetical protein